MTDNEDADHVVRTDEGASIETKIKRGTGTRDQEEFRLKGKGEDAEQALDEFETLLDAVEEDIADRVRNLQTVEEDDG
jgi:hypothetical protein